MLYLMTISLPLKVFILRTVLGLEAREAAWFSFMLKLPHSPDLKVHRLEAGERSMLWLPR